jgi:arsenite-transporting ATPase
VKEIPLYSEEMCGLAALHRLKEDLCGDEDPTQVYYARNTIRVIEENNQYRLDLYLPGIPKEQIELTKTGDELNVRIGNHRRNSSFTPGAITITAKRR